MTVVDGYRPGREWIIGQDVTTLGRGDHLPLPFLGYPGRDLESEHARIVRQPDGAFLLEDNHSRLGTRLNGQSIQSPTPLADGDLIKIGSNIVRFNLRSAAWSGKRFRRRRFPGAAFPFRRLRLRRRRRRAAPGWDRPRNRKRSDRRCRRSRLLRPHRLRLPLLDLPFRLIPCRRLRRRRGWSDPQLTPPPVASRLES